MTPSIPTFKRPKLCDLPFYDCIKEVVFIATLEGVILDANEAIVALLGVQLIAINGQNFLTFIANEASAQQCKGYLKRQESVKDVEVVFKDAQGALKPCALSLCFKEDEGEGRVVQGIIANQTQQVSIEQAALQAEKMAATGRLVRTLAHEVRNPLSNILLALEQISVDEARQEQQLFLNIIRRNSNRIYDLISELLYTSRPAEHFFEPQLLPPIIQGVINAIQDKLQLHHMQLCTHIDSRDTKLLLDKEKLHIALLNIINNAIDAMQPKKGILTISLAYTDSQAILTIADNGVGMSEEHLNRIFEPYFTQKSKGLGLGLTITLNVIQVHKALLHVVSELHVGTTFQISFPLEEMG